MNHSARVTFRSSVKLLIIFTVSLSLLALPGSSSLNGSLPMIKAVRAAVAPNVPWTPAGPSMDTLTHPVFADQLSELAALTAPTPSIDLTDWPLDPASIAPLTASPLFQVTAPISETGYSEVQFHMGQNFWGCQFNFGNAACGTHVRQAFAHGLDKNIFIANEFGVNAQPVDNPVPPSVDLNTPDPCAWDTLFPQNGANCMVNGAGGTAYHLAAAAGGAGCANVPGFAYTPGCGTPDFCAAASHLVAAGLAAGMNAAGAPVNPCVLFGLPAAVTLNPIHIFVSTEDSAHLHAGDSYAQFICALFTGSFTVGCGVAPANNNLVVVDHGPITLFPGYTTSLNTVALTWWVYTGGFSNVLTFDTSLFLTYNSQFVSGIPGILPPNNNCSAKAVPRSAASNYMYICDANYDSTSSLADFAPCLTAPGDPSTGQTHLTVTFANCPGTSSLSSASAAYKSQDIFGQNAYTIPLYSGKNQFAYLAGWQGATLHKGDGFTPPGNFFTTLNAWNPAPPVAGTLRQGYKQGTGSVNPFIGTTAWDQGVMGAIWDSLGKLNPDSPQAYMDWMTLNSQQLPVSSLAYTPPAGTTAVFRYTLSNFNFWHTGQPVSVWDVAFSYVAFKSSGVFPGLASLIGVKVLSNVQIDLAVNAVGPFTKLFLSTPVLPGRDWVNTSVCAPATWDSAANNQNFAAANSVLTACIAQSSAVTVSGVIQPTQGVSNVNTTKIQPSYDPVADHNLIGSGPWTCGTGSGIGGPGCSSTLKQATGPGDSWTLSRYGIGTIPGGSVNTYFRSPSTLALSIWSRMNGNFVHDFQNASVAVLCFGKAVGTSGCAQWQHGFGKSSSGVVGLTQVTIIERFFAKTWVSPYDWVSSPPQNIVGFPPVLHEGTTTLNPCSVDPVNGYDCT